MSSRWWTALVWLAACGPTLEALPAKGAVPIELCEAAGCKKHLERDKETITACTVYPYRPDETEPYVVCSFNHERKATTM